MSLLNKLTDSVVQLTTKQETIRITYTDLAKIVEEEFIIGADDAFLEQVRKTAKGGILFPKELKSANGKYDFRVGALRRGMWLFRMKAVWVFDNDANKFYQLDRDTKWSAFYKTIDATINREKINRNRSTGRS